MRIYITWPVTCNRKLPGKWSTPRMRIKVEYRVMIDAYIILIFYATRKFQNEFKEIRLKCLIHPFN
jgi:hypothetical protein